LLFTSINTNMQGRRQVHEWCNVNCKTQTMLATLIMSVPMQSL
jgi:hypothetical protein